MTKRTPKKAKSRIGAAKLAFLTELIAELRTCNEHIAECLTELQAELERMRNP